MARTPKSTRPSRARKTAPLEGAAAPVAEPEPFSPPAPPPEVQPDLDLAAAAADNEAPVAAEAAPTPSLEPEIPMTPAPIPHVTKRIGLSLGADICWPGSYEEIIRRMNLNLDLGSRTVDFAVERVSVEPYNLRQPVTYDVVIDRLTHWYHTSREWIKKAIIMDGLYVLNNPWSIQGFEKHTSYAAMLKLGLPVPETAMIPPKEQCDNADVGTMLKKYGRAFNLDDVGRDIGYPAFIKPYDGGAWVGVSKVRNTKELQAAYDSSGQRIMHLQKAVDPFDLFVRTVGIGPQVEVMKYDPTAPLHARYVTAFNFVNGQEEWDYLQDQMMTINGFFGWEFNSCESLRKDGVFYPIDFANACPDFQVTSLHFYWPNMVKNMIKWSLFCAATERKMAMNADWSPYYAVLEKDLPFRERLAGYAKISRERMQADQFAEFCETHLSHLDEVAWEFFGSQRCHDLVREKVAALFPRHEIEMFTNHFFGLVQFWRRCEADRLAAKGVVVGGVKG
jgi:hypothetical protein